MSVIDCYLVFGVCLLAMFAMGYAVGWWAGRVSFNREFNREMRQMSEELSDSSGKLREAVSSQTLPAGAGQEGAPGSTKPRS